MQKLASSQTQDKEFKIEAFTIMRQQTNKMKLFSKQIQIKDEQINFLKETIRQLQIQKQDQNQELAELKTKLKVMAMEIGNYNREVVQKIFASNSELQLEVSDLMESNELMKGEVEKLRKEVDGKSSLMMEHARQKQNMSKDKKKTEDMVNKCQKLCNELQAENKKLSTKNMELTKKKGQLQKQLKYFQNQIDILTRKYKQSQQDFQKRYKSSLEKMITRQQHSIIERQLRNEQQTNQQIRKQNLTIRKQMQKVRSHNLTMKDKMLTFQVRQSIVSQNMKADIINLYSSVCLGKKVMEFQSEMGEKIDLIYEKYRECRNQGQRFKGDLEGKGVQIQGLTNQLRFKGERLGALEEEYHHKRESFQVQLCNLQAQYESKVMQISVKLKKQQIALQRLNETTKQATLLKARNQQLQSQKQILQDQLISLKAVSTSTMERLNNENLNVMEQLQTAVKLCQDNMEKGKFIGRCRGVVHELLAVVCYLGGKIGEERRRSRSLYAPFMDYYFGVRRALQETNMKASRKGKYSKYEHNNSNSRSLRKWRSCTNMLIAIFRMKKLSLTPKTKGLQYHSSRALQTRQNIANLNTHLEDLAEQIRSNKKTVQIISGHKKLYNWEQISYQNVVLKLDQDQLGFGWQSKQIVLELDD